MSAELYEDARGLVQPALRTTNFSVKEPSHCTEHFRVRGVLYIEQTATIDGPQLRCDIQDKKTLAFSGDMSRSTPWLAPPHDAAWLHILR